MTTNNIEAEHFLFSKIRQLVCARLLRLRAIVPRHRSVSNLEVPKDAGDLANITLSQITLSTWLQALVILSFQGLWVRCLPSSSFFAYEVLFLACPQKCMMHTNPLVRAAIICHSDFLVSFCNSLIFSEKDIINFVSANEAPWARRVFPSGFWYHSKQILGLSSE